MFVKVLRFVLGRIVLLLNLFTLPRKGRRSEDQMQAIQSQVDKHVLYQFTACPFCVKVRRQMRRLNLAIECRDAKNNPVYQKELQAEGGRLKVPCLRIEKTGGEVLWMYESDDINRYLKQVFPI
ncbi:MAG: glutaredoxin [Pseudomonadales bacterium]|nr:glutaredoxin [Pseudomonadales bacterium]